MAEVTDLLSAIERGDRQAGDQLMPLVYNELVRLAARRIAQEKPGQTLDANALVHEAYLRLVEHGDGQAAPAMAQWKSRGHFFSAAAEAMRRILIDAARRKQRLRHGGGLKRVDLSNLDLFAEESGDHLLALDESLRRLEQEEPEVASVVKLRFFAGLTIEETAASLSISVRTTNRHWAYAKAWLFQALRDSS